MWFVDDIRMKVWIGKGGDVLWRTFDDLLPEEEADEGTPWEIWEYYLHDGIRCKADDTLNGLWMILE